MSTQERVRREAVRLFAERGFHGVGIRDLAQAVGVTSASLYHHMGTKQDLLADIMRASLEHLVGEADLALAAHQDPLDRLEALVRMHVREHAEQRQQTRVVDGEMSALTGPRQAEIVALRDSYERRWSETLAAAAEAGQVRVDDQRLTRLALLEMCSGVSRWYSPEGRLGVTELAEGYVVLARAMVGAPRSG